MTVPWNLDQAVAAMTDGAATLEALYDECCRLIAENAHLQMRFAASQALADQAIKERDEFSDSRNLWNQRFCDADQENERLRAELEKVTGERDRARDLAVRAGAFE